MLGGRDRIAERRVHHDDAFRGRGGNVDIVDANAGTADYLQVLRLPGLREGNANYAAFGSAGLAWANAQSIHGVSFCRSDASTVQPHQMRRPGGASRCVAMS